MKRTIEIDEEAYGLLQRFATPLEETPNEAVRKCLQWIVGELKGRGLEPDWRSLLPQEPAKPTRGERPRAAPDQTPLGSRVGRTPQRVFGPPILQILKEAGGRATADHVATRMPAMVNLTPSDWDPHPTQMYRWKNNMHWQRLRMKHEGLLRDDSPIGVWELSESGWAAANSLNLR